MAALGYRSSGVARCRFLFLGVLLAFLCETWPAGAGRAEDNAQGSSARHDSDGSVLPDLHLVELRPNNMLRQKASRASFVEVGKKSTGPPPPTPQDKLTSLGSEMQKVMDKEVLKVVPGQVGQMQDIQTAADHIRQIADHMNIKTVFKHADDVVDHAQPLANKMSEYASNLMMVPYATKTFLHNVYNYHTKVQDDITRAMNDASLPGLETNLAEYYNQKERVQDGRSAHLRPMETFAEDNNGGSVRDPTLDGGLPMLAEDYYNKKKES